MGDGGVLGWASLKPPEELPKRCGADASHRSPKGGAVPFLVFGFRPAVLACRRGLPMKLQVAELLTDFP